MPNFCSISLKERFEKNTMLEGRIFPLSSSDSQRKTLGSCPKNFWLLSLNRKLHIQGIKFYRIFWCSVTHFFNFRLLAEIFRRVYRNCFLRALRIVLKQKIFRTKKCFLKNFGFRAKKFWIFAKKSARMPNFCSISPSEHFEENNVEKKKFFLYLFQKLIEKRWEVAQKTFGCVL